MDDLDRREAFLLAIFAAPDDDLPRLVFADWLEENGEGEWANRIRNECHYDRVGYPPGTISAPPPPNGEFWRRGFNTNSLLTCPAELLAAPVEFRRVALLEHPHWYGCSELELKCGLIASSKPVATILNSPVTQRVTKLDLSGTVWETVTVDEFNPTTADLYPLHDFEYRPAVTLQAVEALVSARECRRFTHLDLDNDAARAILRSNYLTRLESLKLFDGNQLRGRTWAALQEKFGEEVVS